MPFTITFSKNHPYEEQAGKTFELFRISGDVDVKGDWVWFRDEEYGVWWGWDNPKTNAIARVVACGKGEAPKLGQLHQTCRVDAVDEPDTWSEKDYWEEPSDGLWFKNPKDLLTEILVELGKPELNVIEEDSDEE